MKKAGPYAMGGGEGSVGSAGLPQLDISPLLMFLPHFWVLTFTLRKILDTPSSAQIGRLQPSVEIFLHSGLHYLGIKEHYASKKKPLAQNWFKVLAVV